MEEKTSNTPKQINRRKMLKGVLAAGGAITAAAFLDGKWLKPVVKTGILPVHAQASICEDYTITPIFDYFINEGTAFNLGASVLPDPGDGTILGYTIIDTFNITLTLVPAGSATSGTLVGGVTSFPGHYEFSVTGPNPTVTIEWDIGGCVQTAAYDVSDLPNSPPSAN